MYKTIRFARSVYFLLTLLFFVSFAACGKSPTAQQTEPGISLRSHPHQELTATKAVCSIDTTSAFISIPQIGLENVLLRDATSQAVALQDNVYGQVYLLGDDRYGTSGITVMDHYLVVSMGDQIIAKDLLTYEGQFDLEANIEVCDFDADGDREILVQQNVAMSGGCGAHLTRVFDIQDGQIVEMFSSEELEALQQNQYGFVATLLADDQYQIEHAATGYCQVFPLHTAAAEYYADSSAGKIISLEVDSFYDVVTNDVDSDGITELCCTQYGWYASHADGLGDAVTVWKYNPQTAAFEIIRASFEPYEE